MGRFATVDSAVLAEAVQMNDRESSEKWNRYVGRGWAGHDEIEAMADTFAFCVEVECELRSREGWPLKFREATDQSALD